MPSSKTALTVALSELETLRNISQVMEKSLPYFLPADEKSISGNGLRRPWHSLLCRRLKIQQMSQELLLRCFFPALSPWSSAHRRDGAPRSPMRQQRGGNPRTPPATGSCPALSIPSWLSKLQSLILTMWETFEMNAQRRANCLTAFCL